MERIAPETLETSLMAKHVLVIFNPAAKSQIAPEEWIGRLVEELNKDDEYLVSFYPTTAETTPLHLVPLFKPPLDLVIAAGGDGTVRFALAALARAKSDIPVAIFPLGTGNVLARNLGIVDVSLFADPLERAYEYVKNGSPRRMDMGVMNGHYFAGMAGVGPLSDAFMTPERTLKTKFKLLAYIVELLKSIAKPARTFKITSGGKEFKIKASGIFIGNVQDLGMGRDVEFEQLSDGLLELHAVNPTNLKEYVGLGARFASGKETEDNPDRVVRIKEALIELVPRQGVRSKFQKAAYKLVCMLTGEPPEDPGRADQLPCMIDGEEAGVTPMTVSVIPQAVNVWVPNFDSEGNPIVGKSKSSTEREQPVKLIAELSNTQAARVLGIDATRTSDARKTESAEGSETVEVDETIQPTESSTEAVKRHLSEGTHTPVPGEVQAAIIEVATAPADRNSNVA